MFETIIAVILILLGAALMLISFARSSKQSKELQDQKDPIHKRSFKLQSGIDIAAGFSFALLGIAALLQLLGKDSVYLLAALIALVSRISETILHWKSSK